MRKCDASNRAGFDYSLLSSDFDRLPKPAKRALINAGLFTPKAIAARSRAEIAGLHGIGPTAFPVIIEALAGAGLDFKPDR